jgi:membrane protein
MSRIREHPLMRLPLALVRGARASVRDDIVKLAAALAFYTALALSPLTVVVLGLLSLLGQDAEGQLVQEVDALIGREGAAMVQTIVESADSASTGRGVMGVVSLCALVFSATGVFAELQSSLNTIWGVTAKPGRGVRDWLRRRLLSFAMLGVLAFLLLVSLGASTLVTLLEGWMGGSSAWRFVTEGAGFAVIALLFAAVFRFLPDVDIRWRDVVLGALFTAALFTAGKYAIGLYLARGHLGSAYGAAGSLVVVLAWVYYSAMIVFLGAEITRAWAQLGGRRLTPNRFAVWRDAEVELEAGASTTEAAGTQPSTAAQLNAPAARR